MKREKIAVFMLILVFSISVVNLYQKNIITSFIRLKTSSFSNQLIQRESEYLTINKIIPKGKTIGYIGEHEFSLHSAQFFLAPALLDSKNYLRQYILVVDNDMSVQKLTNGQKYKIVYQNNDLVLLKKI